MAAPGLPCPEGLGEEWSSSSSEESPEYATKPVFSLFTAGSKRAGMQAEGWGGGHSGRVDMEREKNTQHNSSMFVHVKHFKTFWEKQVVNGLKTLSEGGGQPFGNGHWLAGPTVFWTTNQEEGRHHGTSHAPTIRIQHRPREP